MEKYKFSVVMAVYNVELFLREAIESLVEQDIGFENIQLILVDDGAKDSSGAICDEYAAKYPDNVLVLHKENGGVSSARNYALPHVKGKYVNFMDSDDKFTPNTFGEVWDFFEENRDEVDLVSVPLYFFDGRTGQHMLNHKYKRGNRIISLDREWDMLQMHVASAFVCREALEGMLFDDRLAYAEDGKFVSQILTSKCTLGVVASGRYLYRQRSAGEASAIQNSGKNSKWYLPCVEYFHLEMIEYCRNKLGYIPKFVQYAIMYDLQWKIKQPEIPDILSEAEKAEYKEKICQALKYIDDDIIMAQKYIWNQQKVFALTKKYGMPPAFEIRSQNVALRFGNYTGITLSTIACFYEFLKIEGEKCTIEGHISLYDLKWDNVQILLQVGETFYPCEIRVSKKQCEKALGELVLSYYEFCGEFPLMGDMQKACIVLNVNEAKIKLKNVRCGYYFPLSKKYKNAHYSVDDWNVTLERESLLFEKTAKKGWEKQERAFLKELWKKKNEGAQKAVVARRVLQILKKFKRKPIWLISDRATKAADNGEAFYLYMRHNHPEIDAYYVIEKECDDYKRMRKNGPVLARNSFKHKMLSLLSDYIISSHAECEINDPFYGHSEAYRDILADNKFIFLQHGVAKNDLSGWLNRHKKNFYGLVTSAVPEYNSMASDAYSYTSKEVWLTGMPRYDRLYRDEKKLITILPTWRKYLMKGWNAETDEWTLVDNFKDSEYVKFYSALLTNERLLKTAKKYGYRLAFFLHPTLQKHIEYFLHDDSVRILGDEANYRDVYAQSDLILTDYSSAAFDFAYLRKPVVYTHFDENTFFSGGHVCEAGYFEDARDGFGEVEYDLESTVNRIIEYMENGCELKDKYRERIDKFFAFRDQNNCKRVYDRIMQLEKEN